MRVLIIEPFAACSGTGSFVSDVTRRGDLLSRVPLDFGHPNRLYPSNGSFLSIRRATGARSGRKRSPLLRFGRQTLLSSTTISLTEAVSALRAMNCLHLRAQSLKNGSVLPREVGEELRAPKIRFDEKGRRAESFSCIPIPEKWVGGVPTAVGDAVPTYHLYGGVGRVVGKM